MEDCIKNCAECYKTCSKIIMYCLEQGGEHASPDHVRLLMDCAEICKLSTSFMLRDSEFAAKLCELCAEVCERCAQDCASMEDDTMAECAEVCRKCAESCRQMMP
jgi:hypothetical protein